MQRYLVSVITPNYVLKAGHYLDSLAKVGSATPICVQMDTDPLRSSAEEYLWRRLDSVYSWMDFVGWHRPDTHSHNMVQWGRFLDALPFVQPEDLICLTDTDLVVQRDLTEAEWSQIEAACADGNFCASWNCGRGDNLWLEKQRIALKQDWLAKATSEIDATNYLKYDGETKINVLQWYYEQLPCFNCGVLFATAASFRRLQAAYESRCAAFYAATSHRSRCQFLMNYCLWVEGIGVAELPASVHIHGHCGSGGLPEGTHWRGEELWVGEEKVVFRHNLEAPQ